jgi:hypothetical protein
MSYQGTEWARNVKGVNRSERAVLMQIGHALDQRNNKAYISDADLCSFALITERHLIRIRKGLEAAREGYPDGILKRQSDSKRKIGRGYIPCYSFVGFQCEENDIRIRKRVTSAAEKNASYETRDGHITGALISKEGKSDDKAKVIEHRHHRSTTDNASFLHDLQRVQAAFEESPVTTGRATNEDIELARVLLESFSADQIELGILLGSTRRAASSQANDSCRTPVRSLAYFQPVIREAATDEGLTASYQQYLRQSLDKYTRKKLPARATG